MSSGDPEGSRLPARPASLPSTTTYTGNSPALLRQFTEALRSASVDGGLNTQSPQSSMSQRRMANSAYTVVHIGDEPANSISLRPPTPAPSFSLDEPAHIEPDSRDTSNNNGTNTDAVDDDARTLRTHVLRIRETIMNNQETTGLFKACFAFIPFLFIFLVKAVIINYVAIILLSTTIAAFLAAEEFFFKLVKDKKREALPLLLAVLTLEHASLYYFYSDYDQILYSLGFVVLKFPFYSFGHTLLLIMVTDLFVKANVVALKGLVAIIPDSITIWKRKRRIFQAIEYSSQVYRLTLPIMRWVVYFSGGESFYQITYIDLALCLAYLLAKFHELTTCAPEWLMSVRTVMRNSTYGVRPTAEELRAVESQCSICYSEHKSPIKLSCNHIFCEECVDTWLEEKHTCPLCRCMIDREDKAWKSGATSKHIRVY